MCQKKNLGILILDILRRYSSEANPLTKGDIAKHLLCDYGREADQRTVLSTLEQLISHDNRISFNNKKRGSKVFKHSFFLKSEIDQAMTELAALSLISSRLLKNDEIDSVLHVFPCSTDALPYVKEIQRFSRSELGVNEINNILIVIFKAIKDNNMLNFALLDFISDEKNHFIEYENTVKRYLCAPIKVVSSYGRLWLFAELGDTGVFRYFPVDMLCDIRKTEIRFKAGEVILPAPSCELEGERMLLSVRERVILRIKNSYLGEFSEKLGLLCKVRVRHGEYSEIEVICDINALKRHILSFGSACEVLSPTKLRRGIALELQSACTKYREIKKLKGYIG